MLQLVPPPIYGASQPQYSPVVPPPNQQLFVVANAQLVPGTGIPQAPQPPAVQFAPSGQAPYPLGFVPAGQAVANQAQVVPPQPQQAVSSAGLGCVVASPPQQYVVANQPLVMHPTPVNQPFVPSQYTKTAPPNVIPQQFIMMPSQQLVVPPPAGAPPPPTSQVYSVMTNQNVPRPSGPAACIVQPVLAGQRMPLQVAAVPNQFQPVAVPANQVQVMPAGQIQPMAISHLQMVPPNALQVVSTNQPPPAMPANQMQSNAASQPAVPPQPMYCYVPNASVAWHAGTVATNELRPTHMTVNSASVMQHQQPPASANIQVPMLSLVLHNYVSVSEKIRK